MADVSRPRILIVDDDATVLGVLGETLAQHFDVTTADSGAQALEILAQQTFAVMLADQRMPGMTGVELTARARELHPDLVSVMLSAYTDPRDMIAAINEGQIFRFIRKPWDANDLILTLQRATERHQLAVDNRRLVSELERRLRALDAVHEVLGAAAEGVGGHPAGLILDRLEDLVPYDLAALLLEGEDGAALELRSRGAVSQPNATALRDQVQGLFSYFSGREIDDDRVRLRTLLEIDPELANSEVESQAQVPLERGDEVVGVLVLQGYAPGSFPEDVTQLLDVLANGTAHALARVRRGAGRQWGRLESALAALPDGFVLVNEQGRVVMANRVARALLAGVGEGSKLWAALGIDSDALAARQTTTVEGVKLGERVVAVNARPVGDAADAATLLVLRDVTGTHQLDQRGAFVATLSHEIRTPLASITAALDLLDHGMAGELTEQQRHYVQLAVRGSENLKRLVDELIDIERYQHGRIVHEVRPASVRELVRNVSERIEASAAERQVEVVVDNRVPELLATFDPRRIEQVCTNLLNNALKYADRGSAVHIGVYNAETIEGFWVLAVSNVGPVIPAEQIDSVFERFQQVRDPAGVSRSGSGLGLAICRSIVDAHGGAVLAESEPGRTTFWVALPVAEPQTPPQRPPPDSLPVWIAGTAAGPERAAAGAKLRQAGVRPILLPGDPDRAAEAAQSAGQGLTIYLGESTGDRIRWHPGSDFQLAELAGALAQLQAVRHRQVHFGGDWPVASVDAVRAFGANLVRSPEQAELVFTESCSDPGRCLIRLAQRLESHSPTLASLERLCSAVPASAGFGVARLDHLQTYRVAYGGAREAALREELYGLVTRELRRHVDAPAAVQVASSVVFAGDASVVEAVLARLWTAFPVIARLHYRKEDRERGSIKLGADEVPLAELACRQLDPGTTPEALLEVIGDG